jgi:transketolase
MGISEQDMMVTAAGLASAGKTPYVSTFAIFGERGFEQTRNAICRPNLNVKIAGSHGGLLTGADGSSAQAIEDVAVYRSLPNMRVICPADAWQAENALYALDEVDGPSYMKLTRNEVPTIFGPDDTFTIGESPTLVDGDDVTLVGTGSMLSRCLDAADLLGEEHDVSARVVNVATIKPIDRDTVAEAARETGALVTAEDHNIYGGLGSAVAEVIVEEYPAPMERVGVEDTFGESGGPDELYEKYGLTAPDIADAALTAKDNRGEATASAKPA